MPRKLTAQLPQYEFANCIFVNKKHINGCSILRDEVRCDPSTCLWRQTEDMYFASLEKAMHNYEKNTGRKDYIDKYVPSVTMRDRFKYYLLEKVQKVPSAS